MISLRLTNKTFKKVKYSKELKLEISKENYINSSYCNNHLEMNVLLHPFYIR